MTAGETVRRQDERAIRNALFGPEAGALDGEYAVPVEVGELDARLPEALGIMVRSPIRWVLTLDTRSSLYVQFLATEEGVLVAECVSNEFLHGDLRLSEEAEEQLPVLGWEWPAPPDKPNWTRVEFDESAALDSAVLAVHTLRRVFGCDDGEAVYATLFMSANQRSGGGSY